MSSVVAKVIKSKKDILVVTVADVRASSSEVLAGWLVVAFGC